MAFIQQQRPQSSRQIPYNPPESTAQASAPSLQVKQPLEQSEDWVLFSPLVPSTTARTHTTSTERTPRTAGLSRFSEFGSLDTAAQSDHDDDVGTFLGTEEELDSLDDGLHAFHEPSDYGAPSTNLHAIGDTVLPTHDGLGEFEPDSTMQEHIWQFERPRRRALRRRSSVQRHFTLLDDADNANPEQERRQRIERWRLEQSKALLEEIEKETRRRRRMSIVSSTRSRAQSTRPDATNVIPTPVHSGWEAESDSSGEDSDDLSFWQRITRRVLHDLLGLDEDTLSVIFGESLPEEAMTPRPDASMEYSADKALQEAGIDPSTVSEESWQTKLLARIAQELGILVHQLSEHPGAFSTYQQTQSAPDYAGLAGTGSKPARATNAASSRLTNQQRSAQTSAPTQFAPTFPATSHAYSEASLWGIEEEPIGFDPSHTLRNTPTVTTNVAEDLAHERDYWERELDVKMVFNFLVKRFSSHRSNITTKPLTTFGTSSAMNTEDNIGSARRAAIIRQHHPLVKGTADRRLPTSSDVQRREMKRKEMTYPTYYVPQNTLRHQKLKTASSCASQSTKKSKRSNTSGRNYWDLGGSVGNGSILTGEV